MPPSTFTGSSAGGNAAVDEALSKALVAAQGALNTNHFWWKLVSIQGDFGGVVGKNITVEITVK